jgi:hypothetical protein
VYDAQIDLVFYINVAEPTPARVGIGGSAVGLMSFFFDKFAYTVYICVFSIYVLYARFISIMGGKLHNPACDSLQATSINDIESHCSDFPIQSKNRNVYMYRLAYAGSSLTLIILISP